MMLLKRWWKGFVENVLLPRFPELARQLRIARIPLSPEAFAGRAFASAFYIAMALAIIGGILAFSGRLSFIAPFLLFPLGLIGFFYYFMLYPQAKIIRRKWEIDRDVVFAARHILIALKSGMPIYDALLSATQGYGEVSRELEEIMRNTAAGVPLNHALRKAAEETPSENLKRILLHISNTITSGGDVARALEAITEQIASEQLAGLKAYGQKLNPLIMFYMMFGIIFPSIGMAFAIILFSLISGGMANLGKVALVAVAVIIAFLQFLFVNAMESSRPKFSV